MSNASANEQLMLELVNRARLDPAGEAARFGISLNQGLSPGQISATPKQPLAMNDFLITSARNHSQYMINVDQFAHEGIGDGDPGSRMSAAGYSFSGSWTWGENIAWQGSTGSINSTQYIIDEHESLFLSPGHRVNILNGTYREVGVGQIVGQFTQGSTYNASMVTQNFAKTGTNFFVTGVAYNDTNADNFYSFGEARSGVVVSVAPVGGGSPASDAGGSGGGYEVGVGSGSYNVTFSGGGLAQAMTVQVALSQNVKLDVVNGNTIFASDSITLGSGATRAMLIGIADEDLTGNSASDTLTGNSGANALSGQIGSDSLIGGAGNDALTGGGGLDRAFFSGPRSSYTVTQGVSNWTVSGPDGTDTLSSIEQLVFSNQTLVIRAAPEFDFSGEGNGDILFQNTNGQAAIWQQSGMQTVSADAVGANPGVSWSLKSSGDFDGDGRGDLLWQNTSGQAAIWTVNGFSITSANSVGGNPGASWHIIGSGDFNGDVKSDILFQHDNGQVAIWLMSGLGVIGGNSVGGNPGSAWHVKATGDFDADGKSDIVFQNDSGQVAVWLMNGLSLKAADAVGANPGNAWQVKGSGDFDGDGKSDILFQNSNGQVAVWLMNGLAIAGADAVGGNPGSAWAVRGGRDFDADGKSDILFQNSGGQVAAWLMNGLALKAGDAIGANPGSSWQVVTGTG